MKDFIQNRFFILLDTKKLFILVILYYIGPGTVNRLLGRTPVQDLEAGAICVQSKLSKFSTLIEKYNAHKTFQVKPNFY